MFYVFNKANDEGFHEIKDSHGNVVAEAANTTDQTTTTLEVEGHKNAQVTVVYEQETWDAL
jgi:hypothetical protein